MYDIKKMIDQKIQEALEGCFMDTTIYGTGYIKVSVIDGDLNIEHIPFVSVEDELENHKQLKAMTRKM